MRMMDVGKNSQEITQRDGEKTFLTFAVFAFALTLLVAGMYNGSPETQPRKWIVQGDKGMPLTFTGVRVGKVDGWRAFMALYRAEDGRYVLVMRDDGTRWVVLGDQMPTSQEIVDAAGWSNATRDLLKAVGLPTTVSLPPRS